MPRGGYRLNAGRKKGCATKEKINRHPEANAPPVDVPPPEKLKITGTTPLEYLLEVMQDESQDLGDRLEAAKGAAPYVHKRQPQVQEIITPKPLQIEFVVPPIQGD